MIARNGIRSTLRAKGRTVLFTLLILALTLSLTLGLGLWAYSTQVLKQCDETFTSIALAEYIGVDYPLSTAADPLAREAAALLDNEAIAAIDGIRLWEPPDQTLAWTEGYSRVQQTDVPYEGYAILDCFQFIEDYDTVWTTCNAADLPETYLTVNYYTWSISLQSADMTVQDVPLYIYNEYEQEFFQMKYANGTFTDQTTVTAKGDLPEVYCYCPDSNTAILWIGGETYTVPDSIPIFVASNAEATDYLYTQLELFYYASISDALYTRGVYSSMLIIEPGTSGFTAERGKHYLLHGIFTDSYSGNKHFQITAFYEGCETPPFHDMDGGDPSPLFQEYANLYQMANNYIYLEASADVAALEVFQQGLLTLREGRFPEAGETAACVVSGGMADRLSLSVGDTLPLTLLYSDESDQFRLKESEETRTLTITGITAVSSDYDGNVWASADAGGFDGPMFGYELGRAVLDNAKGRQAADTLQAMMPDNVRITLYDQGYSAAAQPLEAMRTTAMAVTIASACGALAVLFLFAYLFVGRQRETVLVLTSLGTPGGKIRLWLLSGASLVAGLAALLGAAAGRLGLNRAIQAALALAQRLYNTDQRYSEATLGVTRTVDMTVDAPLWPAVAAGLAVFAAALLLCLFFLSLARREAAPKRGKIKVHAPKSGTSTAGHGAVRFALLSAKRGGWRSFVVPAVALVMSLFLGILAGNAQSWDSQRDSLYRDTSLGGQAVSTNGRVYSGLTIPASTVRLLWKSELLEDISVSASWRYWIDASSPSFGSSSFSSEDQSNWLFHQPVVIATSSLSAADGFYYDQSPEIEWLEGWDESFLADPSYPSFLDGVYYNTDYGYLSYIMWRFAPSDEFCYPALVSRSFLAKYGLELGSSFPILLSFDAGGQFSTVISVTLTAVGSYAQAGDANLYVPLSFYIDHDWITGETDIPALNQRTYPDYEDETVKEQYFYASAKFDTCRFTLKSASGLEPFRQYLAQENFSAVGRTTSNRVTILLRDQTFTETLGALNRYIAFGQLLFPVLFALVCILGFIVSWLMVNGRRMEFAIMRGVGAGKGRVFLSFFLEQGLLCLLGCILGGAALTLAGAGAAGWLAVAGFLLCYLAGCALSVATVGRTNLMNLLSERE